MKTEDYSCNENKRKLGQDKTFGVNMDSKNNGCLLEDD